MTGDLVPDAPVLVEREMTLPGPPGRHRHSTSAVVLDDGSILAWYTEGIGPYPTHNGVLHQVRTLDEGRHWSDPVAIHAMPGWTCLGLAGLRRIDGHLVAFVGRIRTHPATAMADIFEAAETFLVRSADGGHSWSPLDERADLEAGVTEVFGPGSPIRTADGWLFSACVLPRATGEWYSAAIVTDDDGRRIEPPRIIAREPGLQLSDTDIVRLADGSLYALIREDTAPAYRMVAVRSDDDGRTWSGLLDVPMRGASQALARLADGSLVCAYRDRLPDRPGLSLAVADPGATTWRHAGRLHVGRAPFLGWPTILRLPDDRLGILFCTEIVDGVNDARLLILRDRTSGGGP